MPKISFKKIKEASDYKFDYEQELTKKIDSEKSAFLF